MTPDEFVQAYNCHIQHRETASRDSLELLRLIAYGQIAPNLKKPRPTVQEFWPFLWDKANEKVEAYDRAAGKQRYEVLKNKWKD